MMTRESPLLSVIVPCFDERATIGEILERVLAVPLPKEIIVVDDGSSDGSHAIVEAMSRREPAIRLLRHERNRGKGAAVRSGVQAATGEVVIVQDADLEYDPREYPRVLQPILDGDADVVYGSRFEGYPRRVMLYSHTVANRFLTWLSNLTTNLNLTDMGTGYKAFRREVIQSLTLRSEGFGFEAEVTAKVARRGYRIYEVPISYHGREYWEGKKIRWTDGLRAIATIVKYGLFVKGDSEASGYTTLERMGRLSRYNDWIWQSIAPWVGQRVLEVGAGVGNMTRVMYGRGLIVATDIDVGYVHILRNRFCRNPSIRVERLDLGSDDVLAFRSFEFDTVVCLNVLEHVEDDKGALQRLYDVLLPGGKVLLFVPADQRLFGSMDVQVGHFRRYSREELRTVIESAGFVAEKVRYFNVFGRFGWWLNARVLKRAHLPGAQSRVFDFFVPLLRRLEPEDPSIGLSLIAVATKPLSAPTTDN
jgi:glycosyltransferase involved in cell wall biosynthesis